MYDNYYKMWWGLHAGCWSAIVQHRNSLSFLENGRQWLSKKLKCTRWLAHQSARTQHQGRSSATRIVCSLECPHFYDGPWKTMLGSGLLAKVVQYPLPVGHGSEWHCGLYTRGGTRVSGVRSICCLLLSWFPAVFVALLELFVLVTHQVWFGVGNHGSFELHNDLHNSLGHFGRGCFFLRQDRPLLFSDAMWGLKKYAAKENGSRLEITLYRRYFIRLTSKIFRGTPNWPPAAPPVETTGTTKWSLQTNCSTSWAAQGPPAMHALYHCCIPSFPCLFHATSTIMGW